jgi:hypothetical protein
MHSREARPAGAREGGGAAERRSRTVAGGVSGPLCAAGGGLFVRSREARLVGPREGGGAAERRSRTVVVAL